MTNLSSLQIPLSQRSASRFSKTCKPLELKVEMELLIWFEARTVVSTSGIGTAGALAGFWCAGLKVIESRHDRSSSD